MSAMVLLCGVWGLGRTELGSSAELHMPQSTLQRAICVLITLTPPHTSGSSQGGEGPWEGGAGRAKACNVPLTTGRGLEP